MFRKPEQLATKQELGDVDNNPNDELNLKTRMIMVQENILFMRKTYSELSLSMELFEKKITAI